MARVESLTEGWMALYLDEITEVLRSVGLDSDDRTGFRKFPPGPARGQPRRLYVKLSRRPVNRIDIAGELDATFDADRVIERISRERATAEHRGGVRGELDPTALDDEAARDLVARLGRWVLAAPIRGTRAPSEDRGRGQDAEDDPIEPPPEVDRDQLAAWIANRLGYGNPGARAWFLGMEESCESASELPARLAGGDVEDLDACLARLGYDWLRGECPELQRTWAPLIRAWLVATGCEAPTAPDVRAYQRDHWGRLGGDTVLVELQPLPSPSTQRWPWTSLVGDRMQFWRTHREPRVAFLREVWRTAPAKVLVAYGKSYWPDYRAIAGVGPARGTPLLDVDPGWAETYAVDGRGIVLVRHPVRDNANERWIALGRWLRPFIA